MKDVQVLMNPAELRDASVLEDLGHEYEILGILGRGGNSIVYHARDRELGRDVAIKLVGSNQLDDGEAAARLAREAKLVALLSHPNIVQLLGVRHLRAGLALIMQHVPGRTLKRAIREEGPLPVAVVEHILRDIGSALDYAHRRHIVHRDLKPENIYLDVECGRAMLADFGIARTTESESTLTLAGTALGTPAYMSPEQIDGISLDGRSDLYSLGLVAYEMLSGQQPWAGSNLYTIIYKQKHDELPELAAFRNDIPAYLQHGVESLLKKDREQRCADAAQFLALLPAPSTLSYSGPTVQIEVETPAVDESPTLRYQRDAVDAIVLEPEVAPVVMPTVEEKLADDSPESTSVSANAVVEQLLAGFSAHVPAASAPAPTLSVHVPAPSAPHRVTAKKNYRSHLIAAAIITVVLVATAMTAVINQNGKLKKVDWENIPNVSSAAAQPASDPIKRVAKATPTKSDPAQLKVGEPKAEPPKKEQAETQPEPAPAADNTVTEPKLSLPAAPKANITLPTIDPSVARADFSDADLKQSVASIKPANAASAAISRNMADLSNRDEVQRALERYYPSILRDKGIHGTVLLSVLVGENGSVVKARVDSSSGVGPFDDAALKVSRVMHFNLAARMQAKDSLWVQIPVTFQSR